MTPPVFHLSIPVSDLARSVAFYAEAFGGEPAREGEGWRDVWMFGGQVTLFQEPDAARAAAACARTHFGATLDWSAWEAARARLDALHIPFDREPTVSRAGEPEEQAKLYVRDPDGWSVELKAYRDAAVALARAARATGAADFRTAGRSPRGGRRPPLTARRRHRDGLTTDAHVATESDVFAS